jgi:hypothetical protein
LRADVARLQQQMERLMRDFKVQLTRIAQIQAVLDEERRDIHPPAIAKAHRKRTEQS